MLSSLSVSMQGSQKQWTFQLVTFFTNMGHGYTFIANKFEKIYKETESFQLTPQRWKMKKEQHAITFVLFWITRLKYDNEEDFYPICGKIKLLISD